MAANLGSSPHTRGARRLRGEAHDRRTDHPRIRGEHGSGDAPRRQTSGSSPHTRGARLMTAWTRGSPRIIPAYAGSTAGDGGGYEGGGDHPRIRGEHDSGCCRRACRPGSSPHTRGAPACAISVRRRSRIIPAYAGSTSTASKTKCRRRDHPRIRGEHPSAVRRCGTTMGSSPHTRGAPSFRIGSGASPRIIPAYAGSTSSRKMTQASRAGSSPHTRGALTSELGEEGERRIIPAYAGSTPFCAGPSLR